MKFAIFTFTALLLLPWAPLQAGTPTERPNIVLVMADDQGWGDAGYNGHPELKTPNLDELAKSGLRLNRFYTAHFNCSPTRASIMTGRHPHRMGTFSPGAPIRIQELTVAKVLQPAGYATGHFGKWHLNGKNDRSLGRLRTALRELKVADNTLLWYNSDNGGREGPRSTGDLRGQKGQLWEGGVRVPCLVEWPARITQPFTSETPCSTLDIYPTVPRAPASSPQRKRNALETSPHHSENVSAPFSCDPFQRDRFQHPGR